MCDNREEPGEETQDCMIRKELSEENKEHLINAQKSKGSGSYETTKTDELREEINQTNDATQSVPEEGKESETSVEANHDISKGAAEKPQKGTFTYKSDGAWISKMIITYSFYGEEIKKEVIDSGTIVKIPADAREIEVRFQVRRPCWGDIMKYDRFKKKWCEPYEPHVFRYETPPLRRTFTISGNLWWEAVMRVSDEYHEETGEMVGYIQQISVKEQDNA